MLTQFYSQKLEGLFAQFVVRFVGAEQGFFESRQVIIQGQGIEKWLTLQLAQTLGVVSNVQYPYPASLLWSIYSHLDDGHRSGNRWQRGELRWLLIEQFEASLHLPEFAEVQRFLASDSAGTRALSLADQLADLYEQYLIYRPDWVRRWDEGHDSHWQAKLWRQLRQVIDQPCRLEMFDRLKRITQQDIDSLRRSGKLPQQLSLFGIPSLPPLFIDSFRVLSNFIDVDIYSLNPCADYWGDLPGLKTSQAAQVQHNPLLVCWGGQGRDYFDLLLDSNAEEHWPELPLEMAETGCLLHSIQQAIERNEQPEPCSATQLSDGSLQIHSCHSPMREVQVLHDQLLALFEQMPDLEPQEIVVMTPQIEIYAPFIEAVFGVASDAYYIPYQIADRSEMKQRPLVIHFLQLLTLNERDLTATALLDVMANERFSARFEITTADWPTIRLWARQAGIHRGTESSPNVDVSDELFSWSQGVERLLLGYATATDSQQRVLFDGRLPIGEFSTDESLLLGRLDQMLRTVIEFLQWLKRSRMVAQWGAQLADWLQRLYQVEQSGDEATLLFIRQQLVALEESSELASFSQPVALALFRAALEKELGLVVSTASYMSGGVTCCALMPMRSVPFRVICLLGMDEARFPRKNKPPAFDLMTDNYRKGDRAKREDDRYLFLETLISARDVFYLSYTGRRISDNQMLLPSSVISELESYVKQRSGAADFSLVTEHPLQPFSPAYFCADSPLFSFNQTQCRHSQVAAESQRGISPPFLTAPVATPAQTSLSLTELIQFFSHPTRYLLRQRLAIASLYDEEAVDDMETFYPDALDRYQLKNELLDQLGQHNAADRLHWSVSGQLPQGVAGDLLLDQQVASMRPMVEWFVAETGEVVAEVSGKVALLDCSLHYDLGPCYENGRFELAANNKFHGKLLITHWIKHLVANCWASDRGGITSSIRLEDEQLTLRPVENCFQQLAELVVLYQQGQQQLLPFFPKTSYAYCSNKKGGDQEKALLEAKKAWDGVSNSNVTVIGEGENDYLQMAYADTDPLNEAFEAMAEQIFGPCISAIESS